MDGVRLPERNEARVGARGVYVVCRNTGRDSGEGIRSNGTLPAAVPSSGASAPARRHSGTQVVHAPAPKVNSRHP